MKPLGLEGAPRIDVSCEELEALLEGVRAALGETGYQKLQAAIRTLGYVTELLQNQETTLASLRRLLCQETSIRGAPSGAGDFTTYSPAVTHEIGDGVAAQIGRAHV